MELQEEWLEKFSEKRFIDVFFVTIKNISVMDICFSWNVIITVINLPFKTFFEFCVINVSRETKNDVSQQTFHKRQGSIQEKRFSAHVKITFFTILPKTFPIKHYYNVIHGTTRRMAWKVFWKTFHWCVFCNDREHFWYVYMFF